MNKYFAQFIGDDDDPNYRDVQQLQSLTPAPQPAPQPAPPAPTISLYRCEDMLTEREERVADLEAQLAAAHARAEKAEADAAALRKQFTTLLDRLDDLFLPASDKQWAVGNQEYAADVERIAARVLLNSTAAGADLLKRLQALQAAAQPFVELWRRWIMRPVIDLENDTFKSWFEHETKHMNWSNFRTAFERLAKALKGTDTP